MTFLQFPTHPMTLALQLSSQPMILNTNCNQVHSQAYKEALSFLQGGMV